MELERLEVRVAARLRRDLCDVELVADVAVEAEPLLPEGCDRLARELERDRLVPQPFAAPRLGDDSSLVADDRIVQPGFERVAADRLEHPARDEQDVDAGPMRPLERAAGAWVQERVLSDQRPVEVARDGLDGAGEVVRELQPWGFVRKATRSSMLLGGSDPYDLGIRFL